MSKIGSFDGSAARRLVGRDHGVGGVGGGADGQAAVQDGATGKNPGWTEAAFDQLNGRQSGSKK